MCALRSSSCLRKSVTALLTLIKCETVGTIANLDYLPTEGACGNRAPKETERGSAPQNTAQLTGGSRPINETTKRDSRFTRRTPSLNA